MKILKDNDPIRMVGSVWIHNIRIGTLRGFYKDNEESYRKAMESNHEKAWTVYAGACITADYPGKNEEIERIKKDFETWPLIVNGEVVMIDERLYRAKCNGLNVSDPISFKEV